MSDTQTTLVFCAREQAETQHSIDIDGAGEIVLTCISQLGTAEAPETCGRFLKFPADTDGAGLKKLIEEHKTANIGQVTEEAIDAKKTEILDALNPKYEPEPEEE